MNQMTLLQKTSVIFMLVLLSSCETNPYGEGLKIESLNQCSRVIESISRETCYKNVNESYNNIQQKIDEIKSEEKQKQKLDFKRKD